MKNTEIYSIQQKLDDLYTLLEPGFSNSDRKVESILNNIMKEVNNLTKK